MQWPKEYKVDTIRIQKFNKDHFRNVEYTFLNAFPVAVSAMPVSYDGNQVLECQVTFTYDRYFFGPITSVDKRTFYPNAGVPTPSTIGNQVKESTPVTSDDTTVYDSEVEDQEWGPDGQPTASEQLALYKAGSAETEE